MPIKTIELTNFKSFNELKIDLDRFNILIGANASGKSNFIQIFKFLRNITNHGLENVIWMQGGVEYLRNVNLGHTKNFSLRIHCESNYEYRTVTTINKHVVYSRINEIAYELVLEFQSTRQSYKIVKEELSRKFDLFKILRKNKKIEKKEILGSGGEVTLSNVGTKTKTRFVPPENVEVDAEDIFFFWPYTKFSHSRKSSLLASLAACSNPFSMLFNNIATYDIDSRVSKKSVPIKGIAKLEEDGSNLAAILNNILSNKKKEKKFSMLLRDLLPFIEKIDIYRIADKSFLIRSREKYSQKRYFPAPFISDGTIHITALLIALFFEEASTEGETEMIKIIEEPERNIHPHLMFKIVDMMKNASKNTQIITTSHNPEMVRHADIENILLIDRDKDGFSRIYRPLEKKEIKIFLEKEIGIEELYVKNLLGI